MRRLVIVKLSANSGYGPTEDDSSWRELETTELFRAVGGRHAPSLRNSVSEAGYGRYQIGEV